jgi:F-type H+-transporting ATPase subunit b
MMRFAATLLVATALAASQLFAQEHGSATGEHAGGDPWIWWKWANFALLAILLVYALKKLLPPFFAGRTSEIRKGIDDAQKLKQDAEARAASIEQRMKTLGEQIEAMRVASRDEMTKESERIRRETSAHVVRIRHHAEQEIQAASNQARRELKAYAAQLAVDLAEQRIRTKLDAGTENALIEGFVRDLGRQGARN